MKHRFKIDFNRVKYNAEVLVLATVFLFSIVGVSPGL